MQFNQQRSRFEHIEFRLVPQFVGVLVLVELFSWLQKRFRRPPTTQRWQLPLYTLPLRRTAETRSLNRYQNVPEFSVFRQATKITLAEKRFIPANQTNRVHLFRCGQGGGSWYGIVPIVLALIQLRKTTSCWLLIFFDRVQLMLKMYWSFKFYCHIQPTSEVSCWYFPANNKLLNVYLFEIVTFLSITTKPLCHGEQVQQLNRLRRKRSFVEDQQMPDQFSESNCCSSLLSSVSPEDTIASRIASLFGVCD